MVPEIATVTVVLKREQLKRMRELLRSYNQLIPLCRELVKLEFELNEAELRAKAVADRFSDAFEDRSTPQANTAENEPSPEQLAYEEDEERQRRLENLLDEWIGEEPNTGTAHYALTEQCLMLYSLHIEIRIRSDDRRIAGKRCTRHAAIDLNTGLFVLSYDDEDDADEGFNFAIAVDPNGKVLQVARLEGPEDCGAHTLAHDLYERIRKESEQTA